MSKRRRWSSSGERGRAPGEREARPDSLGREGALGNEAVQRGIEGPEAAAAPGVDVVRDVAAPGVAHTLVALELRPMAPQRLERLLAILAGSALDEGRRAELVDRLEADQQTASVVGQALAAAFGEADGDAVRERAVDVLMVVADALSSGSPDGPSWRTPQGTVDVPEVGSLRARADALVAGLVDSLGDAAGVKGEAVATMCRTVQLAVLLEEEEEEGPDPGSYSQEESGW
ncbi:MAG: hypothetical protein ACI8PZ_006866 [Myxococcota bacterium]|jgi:hypothetical protein